SDALRAHLPSPHNCTGFARLAEAQPNASALGRLICRGTAWPAAALLAHSDATVDPKLASHASRSDRHFPMLGCGVGPRRCQWSEGPQLKLRASPRRQATAGSLPQVAEADAAVWRW